MNIMIFLNSFILLGPHDDVVDWDVDELDKEADKAHESKPNSSGNCYL